MELPFPCIAVGLEESDHPDGVVASFLKQRPSERWILLGFHAVQSLSQLWTAWVKTTRNELRGSCVARSIDAEFMRYLAGTHHISEAFTRSGYVDGSQAAWIVYLPIAESSANSLGHIHPIVPKQSPLPSECFTLLSDLNMTASGINMSVSIEGSRTLGIDIPNDASHLLEEALVAHVLMADDQSSSHR